MNLQGKLGLEGAMLGSLPHFDSDFSYVTKNIPLYNLKTVFF